MDDQNEIVDKLKPLIEKFMTLGYSEVESTIYMVLYTSGPLSCSKITNLTGINRVRVYDLVKKMNDGGLLREIPAKRGATYYTEPYKNFFKPLKKKFKSNIKLLDEISEELDELTGGNSAQASIPSVWVLRDFSAIIEYIIEAISKAEKFIGIMLPPPIFYEESDFKKISSALRDRLGTTEDLKAKIILTVEPEYAKYLKVLYHHNVDLYKWRQTNLSPFGMIYTDKTAMILMPDMFSKYLKFHYAFCIEEYSDNYYNRFSYALNWFQDNSTDQIVFKKKGS